MARETQNKDWMDNGDFGQYYIRDFEVCFNRILSNLCDSSHGEIEHLKDCLNHDILGVNVYTYMKERKYTKEEIDLVKDRCNGFYP